MLHEKKENHAGIWKVVREVRKTFMFGNIDPPQCQGPVGTLLPDNYINQIFDEVNERLGIEIRTTSYEDITNETFETACKIFTYLNFCPPKIKSLYLNLFLLDSPKNILFALTSMLKSSPNAAVKGIAEKTFVKVMERFNLLQHRKIRFENNTAIMQANDINDNTYNHPVHIIDEDGEMSPTALIPFCEFGGNMSAMGVKIDQIDVPVCNSFKEKLLGDQLCYTVDPNKYKNTVNKEGNVKK